MISAIKYQIKPIDDKVSSPINPKVSKSDFEQAYQLAVVNQFPLIQLKGCFFHMYFMVIKQ